MKKKPRIAFVVSKLSSGGAQRVIATLANNLVEEFDITIVTYTNQKSFYEISPEINIIPCFPIANIPSSKNPLQSIRLNFRIYKRIKKILHTEGIDLVIGFITQSNIFSTLAGKKLGIPVIISERTNPKLAKIQTIWRILRKWTYPKANSLVVQTEYAKLYYQDYIKESQIVTLPNPINSELSKRRITNKKENWVLSVGRLHKLKNHAMAMNAFIRANPKGWKLQILGEGAEMKNLKKIASEHENIELLGAKTNIEDYYNKSRIFLFTSYYEGFPNALLEAMHFGLVPISTNCKSGPSEIILEGENGFLVPVGDEDAMVERLSSLAKNDKLIEQIADKAKNSTEKYTAENVTKQWRDLIFYKLNTSKNR